MDTSDMLIVLGGSLSGIVAVSLYALYKNKSEIVAEIKNAETVQLGAELKRRLRSAENHSIAYASVEGVVVDLGKTFSSKNSVQQGVILQTSHTEHKSQRIHGFWTDARNILRDTLDIAPFALQDPKSPEHSILVTEAADAEDLMECLETIHTKFTPHKTTAVQNGIDRFFGEVCHGIEESEEMLVLGTNLVTFGEILLDEDRLKLRPPQQLPNAKYILTRMSRGQLVKTLLHQATTLKTVAIVFGLVTVSLAGFFVWRWVRRYLAWRGSRRGSCGEVVLQRRGRARDEGGCKGSEGPCVVCLLNPREVVTLDCGHISLCCDCVEMLPEPHKCPVCREVVERFLPVYRP